MKRKVFLLVISLLSFNAKACGEVSSGLFDYVLLACLIIVFFCAIALPIAGLLYSPNCSKKNVVTAVILTLITVIPALYLSLTGASRETEVVGILGLFIALAIPTAFYLYYGIKYRAEVS